MGCTCERRTPTSYLPATAPAAAQRDESGQVHAETIEELTALAMGYPTATWPAAAEGDAAASLPECDFCKCRRLWVLAAIVLGIVLTTAFICRKKGQ